MKIYTDASRPYLELHALRAPVGHYNQNIMDNADLYDCLVMDAICTFEVEHDCDIFQLGACLPGV